MRKLLFFLCALLGGISGAKAEGLSISVLNIAQEAATSVIPSTDGNNHWYIITQNRSGDKSWGDETPICNNGSRIYRSTTKTTENTLDGTLFDDKKNYLVRFIAEDEENLYKIQFADGTYISTSSDTPGNNDPLIVSDNGKTFAFYLITDYFGWNLGTTTGNRVDNTGAGDLVFWENGILTENEGRGNNGWKIFEVTLEEIDAINVTMILMNGDTEVSRETSLQTLGESPSVPSSLLYDYSIYHFYSDQQCQQEVNTIDQNTTTIYATVEWNTEELPFEISDNYNDAKWYYMYGHAFYETNNGIFYAGNGNDVKWEKGKVGLTKDYLWAFIGKSPVQGITLVNAKAGNDLSLTNDDPAVMGQEGMSWTLKKQISENAYIYREGSFGLYDPTKETDRYLNINEGAGGVLKYWKDFDNGSTFWVEEPTEGYETFISNIESVIENVGPDLGQYHLSDEANINEIKNEIEELRTSGFSIENLDKAQELLETLSVEINLPQTNTFLRITGKTSNKHLAAGNNTSADYRFNMTNATDASTIFYYDGQHLINFGSGLANGLVGYDDGSENGWHWVYGTDNASVVTFGDGNTNGGYSIQSSSAFFYDAGDTRNAADRGSSNDGDARYNSWSLEEIDELPISITSAGYATLWSPVALQITDDVTVYTGTISDDKKYLNLTELEGEVIPAKTAVILKGDEGSYTFKVTTGGTTVAGPLQGGLGATVEENSILTLQQPEQSDDTPIGFYLYTETGIAGFKAYLLAEAAQGVKGITFGEDTTDGIATVEGRAAESAAIYNLAGQRVEKAVKGVYIVNGKKVLVK